MSKSGSRFGRRSNWFKIHCLLQEQQHQHTNQLEQTQQLSRDASASPLPNIDQNDAKMKTIETERNDQSTPINHFLANLKAEKKRKKSSSDSGASSTDPDYNPALSATCDTSIDDHHHQHHSHSHNHSRHHHHHHHIRRLIDESLVSSNTIAATTKAITSHNALSPYLLPSNRSVHHLSAFLDASQKEMQTYNISLPLPAPPTASSVASCTPFNLLEQNEPMDLSVKSIKQTRRSSSQQRALRACHASHRTSNDMDDSADRNSNGNNSNLNAYVAAKPMPLDLTL